MNDGLNDLDDLIQRANATPWGKTCSALWAQAAAMAEEEGDQRKAVRCYGELCAAYMMGGESTRVIAPFMWLDQMFKSHPEYFEEQDVQALGWYYKYVVSTLRCVPTVPVPQCNALLDEMKQYYMNHGDSMRAYHIRCFQFHRDMGENDLAEESYIKWQNAEHSELSDCERCDPGYQVLYHAGKEQWDLAVAAGDKALAHDGEYCDSQPEALLTEMMEPWLRVGRDAEAWAAHIRAYRRYQQHPRYFEFLQDHWEYLALSGRAGRPERLERGLTILLRHMPWWAEAEHPRLLMDSAVAAYVLLDSFIGEDRQRILPTTLPGEGLAWAPRENVENPTIEQAAEWMQKLALDIAAQFDARPGHLSPGRDTERVKRRMNPVTPDLLPEQSGVEDVTGLGAYESTLTILPVNEAVTSGAEAPVKMDVQTPEGQSATSAQSTSSDEPAQVPLVMTNEWKTMSPTELLERSWQIVQYCPTVYSMELGRRIRQNPELWDSIDAEVPEHLTEAWQWLTTTMDNAVTMTNEEPEWPQSSDDPAYALIAQATALLKKRKLYEAAQAADQATRTESVEPIGVRYEALGIMSVAAKEAGYPEEAIGTIRESVNLAALLGMENEQVFSMWYLAMLLRSIRKYVEAAEVAQNTLDILTRYPQLQALKIYVLEVAAGANTSLDYHDAAAAYHYQAGQILADGVSLDQAATAFSEAANSYNKAHDFTRCIDARRSVVNIVRQMLEADQFTIEMSDPAQEEEYAVAKRELSGSYHAMVRCLFEYAQAIVAQPGIVPSEDISLMEKAMDEIRALHTDPQLDEFFDKDCAWREAEWHSDYAYMLWNCYQYTNAMDEQRAAIAQFRALDDVVYMAKYTLGLAFMYRATEDLHSARDAATEVLNILEDSRFASNPDRQTARKLLKDLSQELGE